MYICRLFHRDQPFEQVDARLIASGSLTLGRDPTADWPLDDREGVLSRIHCTLSVEDGRLLLCDSSTNGTFVDGAVRAPRGVAMPLTPRQTVQLGPHTLLVDQPPDEDAASDATIVHVPLKAALPPAGWDTDGPDAAPAQHPDASLLEAFCDGARLDASAFSGEDPVVLMRELGAIYQQLVLGLATLMAQRTQLKGDHQLDRTSIGAADNNPFKWTAPRRLAQDLLRGRDGAFLSGAAAVRASFEDVAHHLTAVAAGADTAVAAALADLDPDAIARDAAAQGFSLRGRAATRHDVHAERHRALADGGAARAFRAGYEAAEHRRS